jgi:hypothetical protein
MKDQEEPERPVYSHEDYVGRIVGERWICRVSDPGGLRR